MKKPHVHVELIKAWADGEMIQVRKPGELEWLDLPNTPMWLSCYEYRVKPEPVEVIAKVAFHWPHGEKGKASAYWEYDNPKNLKLLFDENGKLIKAEVIK